VAALLFDIHLTAVRSGIAGFLPDDVSAVALLSVTLNMSSTVWIIQHATNS